ncbi:hypothetical protein J4G48_0038160 [Bradyrhizobium barranii subsp. apii]|uniref:hypothetical protein n=1 Tax=Bradyrhizobium barranii TaxID=2992140 RepID=UPI001AA0EE1E|nr:hypothetical protein [Bradyrhizobium barranii]UPT95016.1 hypothetical protein J4G48_0038160 [Bradyrhizobium barranii subsp. apii]
MRCSGHLFRVVDAPGDVIAGHIKWTGYWAGQKPTIRIERHKTGAVIDHPLEERLPTGEIVKFYEEAEAVLATLVRRGAPMILRKVEEGVSKPYSFSGMQKGCPAHEKGNWPAEGVHPGRLPSQGYDRA